MNQPFSDTPETHATAKGAAPADAAPNSEPIGEKSFAALPAGALPEDQKRQMIEHLRNTLASETASQAEAQSSGISSYLMVLRRRWQPFLAVFLLVAGVVAWRMKPGRVTYAATARMLLPTPAAAANRGIDLSSFTGARASPSAGPQVDTIIAIVTSPPLVKRGLSLLPKDLRTRGWVALDDAALAEGTGGKAATPSSVAWWDSRWGALAASGAPVAAVSTVSNDIVDITATSNNRAASVALANTMIDVYSASIQQQSTIANKQNIKFVTQQLAEIGSDLKEAKEKLRAFKEAHQIFDVGQEQAAITQRIAALQQNAQATRTEAEAGATGATVQNDSTANSLQQKAAEARLNYQNILREYVAGSPEARDAAALAAAAQSQVNTRVAALLGAAQNRAREAESALASARGRASQLPALELGIGQLAADVEQLQTTYKVVQDKYTQLRINRGADALSPTPLSPALSASAIAATWSRALMLAILAGLALAALWAALLEQLDDTLHSSDDAEIALHAPALGTMPLLRGKAERRLSHIAHPHLDAPALLESCRLLRTNLMFASASPLRSIVVTSTDAGEGKSLSALNLATAMAMDGKRVVLLDCDLRRPMQHHLLETPLEPGFSNVATGESELSASLRPTVVPHLRLLTAGTLPPNPPELLGSERAREMLRQLSEECDFLVIDSAPILALSDTQVLCSLADGVLLVVAADTTSRRHVRRAQAMLRHAGGRTLGVLFNKAREFNNPNLHNPYYSYGVNGNNKRAFSWKK